MIFFSDYLFDGNIPEIVIYTKFSEVATACLYSNPKRRDQKDSKTVFFPRCFWVYKYHI